MLRRISAAVALASISSSIALAHPGHGDTPHVTVAEMLSEPQGALWFLAFALTVFACVLSWRRSIEH